MCGVDLRWMHRVVVMGIVVLAVTGGPVPAQDAETTARRPNIILIVADDLGYADVGFHKQADDIRTPNIDRLAAGGIRATNGYVSCPVCSPTRAGLMTGRYQQRFGNEFNPGPAGPAGVDFGLPDSEVTLPEALDKAGYATGMVGKWHLGLTRRSHPMSRGFESFFGFPHGSHSYVNARADTRNPIMRGFEPVAEVGYLTDAFNGEAAAFIEAHADRPFFLYLAYNAVHTPMEAPEKYKDRFAGVENPRRRTYAGMLSAMDDGVGQVLDALRKRKIDRNTLIFFISDNGGPTRTNGSRNDPLRGDKATVWEGGIRVPFVVCWPDRLPAGKVYDQPVIALDIFPTALAAARGKPPEGHPLDGVDLLPWLEGQREGSPHETLFWRIGAKRAVRHGRLKLLKNDSDEWELYDLAADIGEQKNLATEQPEAVRELSGLYAKWDSQMSEPRWKQTGARRRARAQR